MIIIWRDNQKIGTKYGTENTPVIGNRVISYNAIQVSSIMAKLNKLWWFECKGVMIETIQKLYSAWIWFEGRENKTSELIRMICWCHVFQVSWYSGIYVLWYAGIMAFKYHDTRLSWHSGIMTLRHHDTQVSWHSGIMTLRYHDTQVSWH